MAKPFSELKNQMSPERRARIEAEAQEILLHLALQKRIPGRTDRD